jgi:lysozyme family protein
MDCLVNPGTAAGGLIIQQAVNRYAPASVKEDGVIGPLTIEIINGIAAVNLLPHFRATRCLYYFRDCQTNPARLNYLYGWLRRACR